MPIFVFFPQLLYFCERKMKFFTHPIISDVENEKRSWFRIKSSRLLQIQYFIYLRKGKGLLNISIKYVIYICLSIHSQICWNSLVKHGLLQKEACLIVEAAARETLVRFHNTSTQEKEFFSSKKGNPVHSTLLSTIHIPVVCRTSTVKVPGTGRNDSHRGSSSHTGTRFSTK